MSDRIRKLRLPVNKNLLEWIVFGISSFLVAGSLAFLLYKTVTFRPSSPEIKIHFESSPTGSLPYRYHITVENSGNETAEEVIMEAVLKKEGHEIEKARIHLPYLPYTSKRESWVNFENDPSLADTAYVRVVSFQKP